MIIILRELRIINFKGISNLTIKFNSLQNFVMGRNGSGKSTISDAYHWLLTDKNSADEKDFEIKPINIKGERAQKLEIEVSGTFIIDGEVVVLRKVYSEKWTKPKGQPEAIFSGNTVDHFWNDVPVKQKEYRDKLAGIIPEEKLKLFSNTGYFNSLKWSERRSVLIGMAGEIDTRAILNSNANYSFIDELFNSKKSIEDYRKEVSVKKKRIKDELSTIPERVDEVQRGNTTLELPFEELKGKLGKIKDELSQVDMAIADKDQAYKQQNDYVNERRKLKYDLETKASNISSTLRSDLVKAANKPDERKEELVKEVADMNARIQVAQTSVTTLDERISNGKQKVSEAQKLVVSIDSKIAACREAWIEINGKTLVFADDQFCCPACKQDLPAEEIVSQRATLTTNFNNQKQSDLKDQVDKSDRLKKEKSEQEGYIETYTKAISEFEQQRTETLQEIEASEKALESAKAELADYVNHPKEAAPSIDEQLSAAQEQHPEYSSLITQASDIEQELSEFKPIDNSELISRRNELQAEVDELNRQLVNESLIETGLKRIEELQSHERSMSQELADLEKKEYWMMQFNIEKMNEVEQRVNEMFTYVSFRMFDRQVNGEIVEACDTLVDGKPIHGGAVNTASVINAGVDIVNVLSKHNNIYTPMFIDGRESVTDLIASECQIINLIVSSAHDKLTVLEPEEQMSEA